MSEHIDKMAMEHLKTGFVFINYPVNESQIHNLDCKLDGMDTSIDIIIELFDKDDNNNDNDILWDRNKQNLHRWVTIETNNKDNSQVGEEIIKSITRMAMKKIIHSR
jgi:adenylate kinase family enzyme